jgi:hypothetical protein
MLRVGRLLGGGRGWGWGKGAGGMVAGVDYVVHVIHGKNAIVMLLSSQ